MRVLAIDTALGACSVAVLDTSLATIIASESTMMSRGHAEAIMPLIARVMDEAEIEFKELDRIAVTTGPGSFTGLRLGLAAARGLAFALDLQVAGVSTLDALAAGAPGAVPVIDAGRREVFTLRDGEPVVCSPHEVEPRLCVGDGALRYRAVLEERGAEVPPDGDERHLPRARFHAQLAGPFVPAGEVEPLYLRLPDAEPVSVGSTKLTRERRRRLCWRREREN